MSPECTFNFDILYLQRRVQASIKHRASSVGGGAYKELLSQIPLETTTWIFVYTSCHLIPKYFSMLLFSVEQYNYETRNSEKTVKLKNTWTKCTNGFDLVCVIIIILVTGICLNYLIWVLNIIVFNKRIPIKILAYETNACQVVYWLCGQASCRVTSNPNHYHPILLLCNKVIVISWIPSHKAIKW